ncbi:MAG: hypothetical protein E7261_11635 [Lachnospiraceae bacterium]|nr:hypothetical protein [Lachnospiraceae bacterium]
MKKTKVSMLIEKPLTIFDYIVFGVIALICYLTFQQGDIMHTAGSSYAYLHGHILDYYDYAAYEYNMWDSYMPSTYIMFAIWNIPMKLFGIVTEPERFADFWVIMWYKLLPVSLYIASGLIIYKIADAIGMGGKKSKLCAYAFLTAPIGFFSQFMFGQYDIFTIFFMLLGLYYYYKNNNKLFILYFALSIPFKLWSILFFVPLLLLKEKNIWKIIRNILLVAIPYAIEFVVYYGNEVFRECVLGFSATSYVYTAGLNVGAGTVSYVVLMWGLICAYAYFKTPENETDNVKWSLYLSCLVIVALFGLSQWHPQWLLLAMPFFVLSAFINKDTKIFMVLDIPMMLFFSIFTVNVWPNHVDQELFTWGIFGDYIYKYIGTKLMMRDLYIISDIGIVFTLFTALLVVSALFKHPKYCVDNFKSDVDNCIGWIRTRFLVGVGIFVIPAVICFVVAALPPYVTYNTGLSHAVTAPLINSQVSEVFIPQSEALDKLEFKVATYQRQNDVEIEVNIVNTSQNALIYTTKLDAKLFKDNSWVEVDLAKLPVVPGDKYRIDISCYEGDGGNCISLYRTEDLGKEKNGYAFIKGEAKDYHLCIRIYEQDKNNDNTRLFGWVWDKNE